MITAKEARKIIKKATKINEILETIEPYITESAKQGQNMTQVSFREGIYQMDDIGKAAIELKNIGYNVKLRFAFNDTFIISW